MASTEHMEQDTAPSGEGFAPKPMEDILRAARDPAPEPAARPDPTPAPVAATGEPAPTQPDAKDGPPRDPAGRFAPKAEGAPEPVAGPPPEQKSPQSVPVSALLEERGKRQALERELAEVRAGRAAPPAPQPAPQQPQAQPEPDLQDLMFSDPARFVAILQERQDNAMIETRLAASEALMREKPDYADAEAALTAYAQSSPEAAKQVRDKLRSHPAPAVWAYQAGKQLMARQKWAPAMQQHADPEAYINAEVERRMAERAVQQPAPPAASPAPPPPSLAGVRSAAPRSGAAPWNGPKPMSAILGRR